MPKPLRASNPRFTGSVGILAGEVVGLGFFADINSATVVVSLVRPERGLLSVHAFVRFVVEDVGAA